MKQFINTSIKPRLTQYLLRRKYGRKHRQIRIVRKGTGKNIPHRTDIDLRSMEANLRLEFGHFEADTIESSKKRGEKRSCLTVISDRASRKTVIFRTVSKTALETNKSLIRALKQFKDIKSITYDNGCEFCQHEKVNKKFQGLESFFCKPYHGKRNGRKYKWVN